jgi:2-dehydropantoate 2-reductase
MSRYVIFGAGAVGGVVGARLHQAGHAVALIARGAHLEAIRRDGLTLTTPVEEVTMAIPAAADPAQLGVGERGDDIVLLAVKSQDTAGALQAVRATGSDAPIVCLQNGVDNERSAARLFADVYGAVVMAPTAHLRPGEVRADGAKASGIIDMGRYPTGIDERCEAICAALSSARLHSTPSPDVMRRKYAKLLLNLGNAVGALFGDPEDARSELTERLRTEGRAALDGAGIDHRDEAVDDLEARWELLGVERRGDRTRVGSSSWQSLARGAGTIETDYLNGEIALLGRLHGVPTPLNAAICRLAAEAASRGAPPGALSIDEALGAVPA